MPPVRRRPDGILGAVAGLIEGIGSAGRGYISARQKEAAAKQAEEERKFVIQKAIAEGLFRNAGRFADPGAVLGAGAEVLSGSMNPEAMQQLPFLKALPLVLEGEKHKNKLEIEGNKETARESLETLKSNNKMTYLGQQQSWAGEQNDKNRVVQREGIAVREAIAKGREVTAADRAKDAQFSTLVSNGADPDSAFLLIYGRPLTAAFPQGTTAQSRIRSDAAQQEYLGARSEAIPETLALSRAELDRKIAEDLVQAEHSDRRLQITERLGTGRLAEGQAKLVEGRRQFDTRHSLEERKFNARGGGAVGKLSDAQKAELRYIQSELRSLDTQESAIRQTELGPVERDTALKPLFAKRAALTQRAERLLTPAAPDASAAPARPAEPARRGDTSGGYTPALRDRRLKARGDFRKMHKREPTTAELRELYRSVEAGLL